MGKIINRLQFTFLILILTLVLNSCKSNASMIDKTVVKELDVQKYLGTWYEIARYPHSFEKDLQGVTANYTLREDGKIKVVNSGYKGSLNGQYSEAIGKAKIPDPINEPAKLKVSFFWIFYGDYFVLELDKDYQYALIGSSSDKFLWILSRSPQMDKLLYQDLIKKLQKRGYDTSKLIVVQQPKN